jgi:C4-type Zn-finger protein
MKIKTIISEHRNDFTADMECEHCGNVQRLTSGYHDAFYHTQVIPSQECKKCGLNRAGVSTQKQQP